MPLYPSTSSIAHFGPKLLSASSGWFYVQILILLSSADINNLREAYNIKFSSDLMVSPGVFKMYLTEKQVNHMISANIAKLVPITHGKKLLSNEVGVYLVRSIENWVPPPGSWITAQITDTIYTVRGTTEAVLLADKRVLSAELMTRPQLMNRYSTGYIQSKSQDLSYYGDLYTSNRIANRNGLDGKDQIVTVLDTGLDTLHSFFYDRRKDVPINKTDLTHRKIVRYDALVDSRDCENGHGTHVCGSLAGNPNCVGCGFKMYQGMAPEAKIYFIDTADSNETHNNISGEVNWKNVIPIMRSMKSFITSNSWGFPIAFPAYTLAYDKMCYENPDILHIFAAGNYFRYMTILAPGDGKNILTVGATTAPKSRDLDNMFNNDLSKRYVGLNNTENDELPVRLTLLKEIDLWNWTITDSDKIPIDAELVDYDETNVASVNGKIVRLDLSNYPKRTHTAEQVCQMFNDIYDNYGKAIISPRYPMRCKDTVIRKKIIIAMYETSAIQYVSAMNRGTFIFGSRDESFGGIQAAAFTSKGPTWTSLTKPEISAPGDRVISAKSGNPNDKIPRLMEFDTLSNMSGTSMSTPLISGAASMIRQYFVEKYYPTNVKGTGKEIIPSASLIKAMLINSADNEYSVYPSVPGNDIGYGIPILSELFGYTDVKLRIVDNQKIESRAHHVYTIKVKNTQRFSVSLSYLDPPIDITKGYVFFADLDLYVEDPDGVIKVANIPPHNGDTKHTDQFATNERVYLRTDELKDGDYKVHITSSVFPMDLDIKYSLVISGDLDASNPEPITFTKGTTCPDNCNGKGKCVDGQCECENDRAGFSCKIEIRRIVENYQYSSDILPEKEIVYYSLQPYNTVSEDYPLILEFGGVKIQPVACFSLKMGPLANPDWKCYQYNNTKIEYKPASSISNGQRIYIGAFQAARKGGIYDSERILIKVKSQYNGGGKPPEPKPPGPPPPVPAPPVPAPPIPAPPIPIPPVQDPVDPRPPRTNHNPIPPLNPVTKGIDENNPNDESIDGNKGSNKNTLIGVAAAVGGVTVVACIVSSTIFIVKKIRSNNVKVDHRLSDEL